MTFQWVTGLLGAVGLAGTLELVRRRRLREGLAALWGLCAAVALGIALWPEGFGVVAGWLELPVGTLGVALALFGVAGITFALTLRSSRQADQIKQLAQELALLEARVGALEGPPVDAGEVEADPEALASPGYSPPAPTGRRGAGG